MVKKSLSPAMKTLKSQQNNRLKEEAENNTTVQKGSNREGYSTVKQGVPLDHDTKQKTAKGKNLYEGQTFGMSKGITKNMDNYESLRVDCWLSDTVHEGETVEEAFTRVEAILDEVLEETVLRTIEE